MKKAFLVLFAASLMTMTGWTQGTSSPAGATAQADTGTSTSTTTAQKRHHRKHKKHRKHHKARAQ